MQALHGDSDVSFMSSFVINAKHLLLLLGSTVEYDVACAFWRMCCQSDYRMFDLENQDGNRELSVASVFALPLKTAEKLGGTFTSTDNARHLIYKMRAAGKRNARYCGPGS